MAQHLLRDLDDLKQRILGIGQLVVRATDDALTALIDGKPDLARQVIANDMKLDALEVQIEEDCLKALALHQPVAGDLRFVIMVLKVNNDLERVGDLAGNICERALDYGQGVEGDTELDFRGMGMAVRTMLREAVQSLVTLDTELARKVCRDDDIVDRLHARAFKVLQDRMRQDSAWVRGLPLLSVSRNLERIADLATNIAEDVIFMVEGDVVRHDLASREDPSS